MPKLLKKRSTEAQLYGEVSESKCETERKGVEIKKEVKGIAAGSHSKVMRSKKGFDY